jgi:hypothetical protein
VWTIHQLGVKIARKIAKIIIYPQYFCHMRLTPKFSSSRQTKRQIKILLIKKQLKVETGVKRFLLSYCTLTGSPWILSWGQVLTAHGLHYDVIRIS